MSLVVVSTKEETEIRTANDLPIGTWFMDEHDQVYVIALDDVNGSKRVVSLGDMAHPFISTLNPNSFEVARILPLGSVLRTADIDVDKPVGLELIDFGEA